MHKTSNAMPSRMTASKHKKVAHPHKFRRSTITAAANGGYVVEHQPSGDEPYAYDNEQKHAFANSKAMHDHLQEVYPAKAKRGNVQEEGEQA